MNIKELEKAHGKLQMKQIADDNRARGDVKALQGVVYAINKRLDKLEAHTSMLGHNDIDTNKRLKKLEANAKRVSDKVMKLPKVLPAKKSWLDKLLGR